MLQNPLPWGIDQPSSLLYTVRPYNIRCLISQETSTFEVRLQFDLKYQQRPLQTLYIDSICYILIKIGSLYIFPRYRWNKRPKYTNARNTHAFGMNKYFCPTAKIRTNKVMMFVFVELSANHLGENGKDLGCIQIICVCVQCINSGKQHGQQ